MPRQSIAPPPPAPKPLPKWATETPRPTSYELAFWSEEGTSLPRDNVQLTRAEFIELKRYLASMRGYEVPDKVEDEYCDLQTECA